MSSTTTQSLYRLPPSLRDDLEQMRLMTDQFRAGTIPPARYQAFRVPQGIYEQRESGAYMLRVRLPAGMLLPGQMRALAAVARAHGNDALHLTSRQDIQVHRVPAEGIYPALTALANAGLSTKGGGGNTVRNIAACPHAGVCGRETFDVTPHVVALTEFMLPDALSYQLPRKYKIAFSGCGGDCAAATVHDLGFIAKQRDGVDGFAVYVGGGMGAVSRVAVLLEEFIRPGEVCRVAEAVKRVFDKHGNRKNRHRARLRFLIEEQGLAAFQQLYRAELAQLQVAAPAPRPVDRPAPGGGAADFARQPAPGFAQWRAGNTQPQKQAGFYLVEIPTPLGVIEPEQLQRLADVVEGHGEGMLRATQWQNLMLRWVQEEELPAVHAALQDIGLAQSRPPILRRMVACAGAATCRLGICLARGLAQAISSTLSKSDLKLNNGTGKLRIHASGCPNACGRHPIAPIGFAGAARRIHGRLVPHYNLQLGGRVQEGKTTLATPGPTLPARSIPDFLVEFLHAFEASPQHPDFPAFLAAGGQELAAKLAQHHASVPTFEQNPDWYFDWGGQEPFSLAGRGPGECGAGVFDLINIDLATAGEALEAGKLLAATVAACRALLVTKGEQADADAQAIRLFRTLFVEAGLVPATLTPLLDQAGAALAQPDPQAAATLELAQVTTLLAEVRKLYEGMGQSLRLPAATAGAGASGVACSTTRSFPTTVPADVTTARTADFRGVVCPLNYVKTKMALARLTKGQVLAVLLDEKGTLSVPESAAKDGQEILAVAREGDHWRVVIRKA